MAQPSIKQHGFDAVNLRRATVSSVIGSTIEWYDFFLYGVVAGLVFNRIYFPTDDIFISTLLSYGVFAVGFIARPVGGMIFGHFGDILGRKKMLIITLAMMGGATVMIGLIPTPDQIGIAAPILLLVCRIVQGIGLGGEWGGAVLMTYESAPHAKRGFFGSLPQTGMSLGLVLASGVVGVLSFSLSEEAFLSWGWRVAFLLSIVFVIIGQYIRQNVAETPDFEKKNVEKSTAISSVKEKWPLIQIFQRYPKIIMACIGARLIDGVFFNVFGVFSIKYMTDIGVERTTALMSVTLSAIVMTAFIPFWGYLSDHVGRAKVYGLGALCAGLSAFPAFFLMHYFSSYIVILWLAIIIPFGIFHAAVFGVMSSFFSECFDANVRYTGISFVYQVGAVFASGFTPIIATVLLKQNGGLPWLLCLYVVAISFISVWCTRWIYLYQRHKAVDAVNTYSAEFELQGGSN